MEHMIQISATTEGDNVFLECGVCGPVTVTQQAPEMAAMQHLHEVHNATLRGEIK